MYRTLVHVFAQATLIDPSKYTHAKIMPKVRLKKCLGLNSTSVFATLTTTSMT